jgi:hypothetical protein
MKTALILKVVWCLRSFTLMPNFCMVHLFSLRKPNIKPKWPSQGCSVLFESIQVLSSLNGQQSLSNCNSCAEIQEIATLRSLIQWSLYIDYTYAMYILYTKEHRKWNITFFFVYSFIHMCIHCLDHLFPAPAPTPYLHPLCFQAEPVLPSSPILLKT